MRAVRPSAGATVLSLRSLLFVPGDRPERFSKAVASGADALILDLEDSVAIESKATARSAVRDYLLGGPRQVPVFVRINPLDSSFIAEDLEVASARPDGIVLPKAEGPASVRALIERLVERLGGPAPPILPIATETAAAVFTLGGYGSVAEHLAGLTWGAEDLPAAIGARAREGDGAFTATFQVVRSLALLGAHAAGVAAIETVFPAIGDLDSLARYVADARRDGFTGMMALHPAQVAVINAGFTPSDEEVAQARRIIEAFAAQPGAGVLKIDGRMIDAPHLKQAHRILAQAAR